MQNGQLIDWWLQSFCTVCTKENGHGLLAVHVRIKQTSNGVWCQDENSLLDETVCDNIEAFLILILVFGQGTIHKYLHSYTFINLFAFIRVYQLGYQ